MIGPGDPLGAMLLRSGVLDDDSLADVLQEQRHNLPVASLAYVLGHASETELVRVLSTQSGVPGVALDESTIDLELLDLFDPNWLKRECLLPFFRQDKRLYLAASNPARVERHLRQIEFELDLSIVVHVSLQVTLARSLRQALGKRRQQGRVLRGGLSQSTGVRPAFVVAPVSFGDKDNQTQEVALEELLQFDSSTSVDDPKGTQSTSTRRTSVGVEEDLLLEEVHLDLDEGPVPDNEEDDGQQRVLIVDDDFASRHLLVKELQPDGFQTLSCASGSAAVRLLKQKPPSAVILDVMLPEIDGFQICRAIKQSKRYRNIPVILMSAVVASGQVSEKVLGQYKADAYFEKPLNTDSMRKKLHELLDQRRPITKSQAAAPAEDTFQLAMDAYRNGEIEAATEYLRRGIEDDPLSTKHHFVLGNLLQKSGDTYEAIEAYEVVVDLRPDYFPALTRLAYLYYKKGFSAKAVETWRRALPFCPNEQLRENIEVFMQKLISTMQSDGNPGTITS